MAVDLTPRPPLQGGEGDPFPLRGAARQNRTRIEVGSSGRLLSRLPWLVAALAAGTLAGLLAPQTSALLLAFLTLGILTLIDPRVGLLLTLAIAPLKALIETEVRTPLPLPLPLNAGHILLLGTLAVWAARGIASPRRRADLSWSPVYAPVLLFTGAAALSLLGAASFSAGLTELLKWVEILLVMALVIALGREGGPGWIAAGLIASALPQAVVGVYQFFGGSGAPHLWILNFEYFRAFGTFGQPNPFGAFMGLSLALALGMAFGQSQATRRIYADFRRARGPESRNRLLLSMGGAALALMAAGVLAVGLLASWSRGAWLGFAAAFGVMLLFAPRRRALGVALVAVVVAGLWLSVVTGIAPDALVARLSDFAQDLTGFEDVRGRAINDDNYAVVERLAHWQAAISMARESPWLGVGFGNYEIAYPRYALVNWPMALGHAHNYYLNLLAETGIVGLTAYLVAWAVILALTLRALRQTDALRRGIALGVLGAWSHLAVHSFFDKLYVNNLFLHLGAMLGIIGVLLLAGGPSPAQPVNGRSDTKESRHTAYAAYRAQEPE